MASLVWEEDDSQAMYVWWNTVLCVQFYKFSRVLFEASDFSPDDTKRLKSIPNSFIRTSVFKWHGLFLLVSGSAQGCTKKIKFTARYSKIRIVFYPHKPCFYNKISCRCCTSKSCQMNSFSNKQQLVFGNSLDIKTLYCFHIRAIEHLYIVSTLFSTPCYHN